MLLRMVVVVGIFSIGGCASNVTVIKQAGCTSLRQSGYSTSLSVQSNSIKWFTELRELPAAHRIVSVALKPTVEDEAAGVVGVYLDAGSATNGRASYCERILSKRLSCEVQDEVLSSAGFSLRVVAEEPASPESVLSRARAYLQRVSACSPSAT